MLYVEAFGNEELMLKKAIPFTSKGSCEVLLERTLNDARTHGGLATKGVRFGGACVLIES